MVWCIAGDFNDLLSHDDKQGRVPHPDWLLSGLKEVISDCSLLEVPLHRYPFTWERRRGTVNWVQERLDKVFATGAWLNLFPLCKLTNLIAGISNHSSTILNTIVVVPTRCKRRFRVENAWLSELEFQNVVHQNWVLSTRRDVISRLAECSSSMDALGTAFSLKFRKQIVDCKMQLDKPRHQSTIEAAMLITELRGKLLDLLIQEEQF